MRPHHHDSLVVAADIVGADEELVCHTITRTGLSLREVTFIANSKNATALQHSRLGEVRIRQLLAADIISAAGTETSERFQVSDTMRNNLYLDELPVVELTK